MWCGCLMFWNNCKRKCHWLLRSATGYIYHDCILGTDFSFELGLVGIWKNFPTYDNLLRCSLGVQLDDCGRTLSLVEICMLMSLPFVIFEKRKSNKNFPRHSTAWCTWRILPSAVESHAFIHLMGIYQCAFPALKICSFAFEEEGNWVHCYLGEMGAICHLPLRSSLGWGQEKQIQQ